MQRVRTTTRSAPGTRFLDPAVLTRIGNLELVVRSVVDGFLSGLHRSRHLGISLDFAEHRQYMPGDDIRRIDWRLFARTDRYHVKEFEAETSANIVVLVDVSRSMRYGSAGIPKLDYARYLAGSLAYLSNRQRDRIGLATYDTDIVEWIPPSTRRFETVLHTLERADRQGASTNDSDSIARPLGEIAGRLHRRGIAALISDLYEAPEAVRDALRRLRYAGHDVIVFHVLDSAELEFPFEEPLNLRDLETGARIPVVPAEMRERYRERINAHVAALSRLLGEDRIDYARFDTGTPLDHALHAYLASRQRLARVR